MSVPEPSSPFLLVLSRWTQWIFVKLFERGVQLSNACKAQLASAESRIQVLVEPEAKGDVRVEDLAVAVADDDDEDQ